MVLGDRNLPCDGWFRLSPHCVDPSRDGAVDRDNLEGTLRIGRTANGVPIIAHQRVRCLLRGVADFDHRPGHAAVVAPSASRPRTGSPAQPPRLRPRTLGSYRSILDRHLLPEFGDRPVAALDHPLTQRYIARLVAEGKRPKHRQAHPYSGATGIQGRKARGCDPLQPGVRRPTALGAALPRDRSRTSTD
ncbi:MAG: hypothetical protein GEU74_11380 [Nitriliruptorales bacterium]|nr:hypothetical protein [Nitriliruptorales bacterium]